MVIWITGNSGSGKTTLANQIKTKDSIILDGDSIRNCFPNNDLSKAGRWKQNESVALLARDLERQGFNVIVALICPYKELRELVKIICGCSFIYLTGTNKDKDKNYPYEYEDNKFYFEKALK